MIIVTSAKVIRLWAEASGSLPGQSAWIPKDQFLVRLSLASYASLYVFEDWGPESHCSGWAKTGRQIVESPELNMCWICLFVLHFFVVCLCIFKWVSRLWLVNGRKAGEETYCQREKACDRETIVIYQKATINDCRIFVERAEAICRLLWKALGWPSCWDSQVGIDLKFL